MKLLYTIPLMLVFLLSLGCGSDDTGTSKTSATNSTDQTSSTSTETTASPRCTDGVKNGEEEGVDCGGPCKACTTSASCTDGAKNGEEEGIDCGGPCKACPSIPTCTDGVKNGGEEGVDCGGPCKACTTSASCTDGVKNGEEEGIDCGGPCKACAAACKPMCAFQSCGDDGCGNPCAMCNGGSECIEGRCKKPNSPIETFGKACTDETQCAKGLTCLKGSCVCCKTADVAGGSYTCNDDYRNLTYECGDRTLAGPNGLASVKKGCYGAGGARSGWCDIQLTCIADKAADNFQCGCCVDLNGVYTCSKEFAFVRMHCIKE